MSQAIEHAEPLGYHDVVDTILRLKLVVARRIQDERDLDRAIRRAERARRVAANRRRRSSRKSKTTLPRLRLV